jgi:hypothetical protein
MLVFVKRFRGTFETPEGAIIGRNLVAEESLKKSISGKY